MALARTYAFTMPTLSERVVGLQRLIDEKLKELRLKKDRGCEPVYLRMAIYDDPDGYSPLEEILQNVYESAGWRVSFANTREGATEIILS